MSRRDQFSSNPSPVERYYTWSSVDAKFKYYDKNKGAKDPKDNNILVDNLSFGILTSRSSVSGWDGDETTGTNSQIYANEVQNTKLEQLTVRTSKPDKKGNTVIGIGFYQDLKVKLPIHFERVIYGYEQGVGIIKINLKGAALMVLSTFEKANKNSLFDFEIVVNDHTKAKKGSIKYTTPIFKLGAKFNAELDKLVDGAYKELEVYLKGKGKNNEENDEDLESELALESPPIVAGDDELPF